MTPEEHELRKAYTEQIKTLVALHRTVGYRKVLLTWASIQPQRRTIRRAPGHGTTLRRSRTRPSSLQINRLVSELESAQTELRLAILDLPSDVRDQVLEVVLRELNEGTYDDDFDSASASRGRHLTGFAAWVAGSRRAHLRTSWLADLAGAPEDGLALNGRQRMALALGFVVAALRLRLHDLSRPLWAPVDWILSAPSRVRTAITTLVGTQAVYIDATGGLHELLTDGVQACGVTGAGLYCLSRWLLRVRAVELASRTRETQPDE
ncbi:hypothetical protein [Kitasatospora purpeofusca]|uniref:hypothetical protein n=1 Tax=Kitasatospora purpeofusca TaxID=67352 RepID=UPI00068967CC|nr:hypothetical protein [Kitasatospora purpeofusca]